MKVASVSCFVNRNRYIVKDRNLKKIQTNKNNQTKTNYSLDNLKANYLINFSGNRTIEATDKNGYGSLNHKTSFFREQKIDEFVQNYIYENFSNDSQIKIVSGACSSGEEVKSYAMMLDDLKDKVKISGFDISSNILDIARKHFVDIISRSNDMNAENILYDDIKKLSSYQRKCREKFYKYYTPVTEPISIPIHPNAKKQLANMRAIMKDEVQYKKFAIFYALKLNLSNPSSAEIEKRIKNYIKKIEQDTKAIQTTQTFTCLNENVFDNCDFIQGDVLELEKLYEQNSVNVLLYRNALYHNLCTNPKRGLFERYDSKEIMNNIAKQMNKILKDKGLVVFGKEEGTGNTLGVSYETISNAMLNNGFIPIEVKNSNAKNPCVWKKCRNI